jgi:hypothetical protein
VNHVAEFLAMLDVALDPEPGVHYPTMDEYTEALEYVKRGEAARSSARPPALPTFDQLLAEHREVAAAPRPKPDPKPKPKPAEVVARAIDAPPPARQVALEAQIIGMQNDRRGVHRMRDASLMVNAIHEPRWRIAIVDPSRNLTIPLENQTYPRDRRDLAEGALALWRARQPQAEFTIIAE